ncbi:MAG: hypothetical protein ABIQ40_03385 [Bacteroidia bacterium]
MNNTFQLKVEVAISHNEKNEEKYEGQQSGNRFGSGSQLDSSASLATPLDSNPK